VTDATAAEPSAAQPGWWRHALDERSRILAIVAIVAIVVGGVLVLSGSADAGRGVWWAAVFLLAVDLSYEVLRTVLVDRHLGVDTIALVAMVGSLILGEELAGAVVGLMFTGGAALESAASKRARRELTALVQRAPRFALRQLEEGGLEEVPVAAVVPGDVVTVRSGEVVPVDGTVLSEQAVLDTSTLTGEPLPVTLGRGQAVLSGTSNAGDPCSIRADRPAAESAYAALVRLVRHAQTERAPFVRMADRYAGIFLPVTLVLASVAWAISGDPVRALAVVVVATPCPLILAAPIALVSGVSRAARRGVIVKGAGVIESLGQASTVMFDKTGTLTVGHPVVHEISPTGGLSADEVLRLAASVDRLSAHVLAEALVGAAAERGLQLSDPVDVREWPGQGLAAEIDGRRVLVGSDLFIAEQGVTGADSPAASADADTGETRVLVAVDGEVVGTIVMADEIRHDAAAAILALRRAGIDRIVLASGDRRSVVERVGGELGLDELLAEQGPDDKLAAVRGMRDDATPGTVVMVGDGINDAPALAIADVGIAMGAGGATVSSETADAVVMVDRIDRVADSVQIGRRSLFIARQSVLAGMGLSIIAMFVAAAGYLPPVAGALLQEVIDLAVILNALRALRE
jgi:heavy metal translocating P-type ATPase